MTDEEGEPVPWVVMMSILLVTGMGFALGWLLAR
jgi:hypothetical protein